MLPDSECLKVVSEILDQLLSADSYVIRVNHKLVLDGILEVCCVPAEMMQTICSSIDKYDGVNRHKSRLQLTKMMVFFLILSLLFPIFSSLFSFGSLPSCTFTSLNI